jgi:hypothetical protein
MEAMMMLTKDQAKLLTKLKDFFATDLKLIEARLAIVEERLRHTVILDDEIVTVDISIPPLDEGGDRRELFYIGKE